MKPFPWLPAIAVSLAAVGIALGTFLYFEIDALRYQMGQFQIAATQSTDSLEVGLSTTNSSLDRVMQAQETAAKILDGNEKAIEDLRTEFATIGGDLKSEVRQQLVTKIIEEATAEAIGEVIAGALESNPAFSELVAEILAKKYAQVLIGPSGADADEQVVASYLARDAEFLDAVSVELARP